ncbi:MAG: aldose epimerase [Rhodobacteraceae bacterium]|jgi:galactose mutarotase-like enzyme|uniref:Galactose mutarotase-like enzyme n=1 Tax=Salipiger profundus TaxID=1229727 RepID=A0A1U7D7B7_9RHOB|nr:MULTISPECIES: aldose 1-epimerase family protein [Salipiger]APX23960.1 galactose mutarotase-like enzyme [Salipiger profundus]MAB06760.1 aldose epimerase [Paracoccaceae bacterium]GFZ93600.1 aldose 1-epimerase [Salipiger profundus]SFB95702.1 Galactose mutarotase [Salipiger profundus]
MTDDTIRIANDALSATIAPLGAEMQTLRTAAGDDLLWHGDPTWWSGRAPILFPIVGRAPGNRIAVGDHEAEMRQHGFARRATFAIDDHGPDHCRHVLRDDAETRTLYPFAFELSVTHGLEGDTLAVGVEITNHDDREMPFGFGFHPAFAWPLPGAKGLPHEVLLANGAEPALARLSDGLLPPDRHASPFDEGRLVLDPTQFEADAMIFPEGAGDTLRYGVPEGPQLSFRFENLPNLALWTIPGAPYLCVEPWHGMAAETGASPQISERPFSLALAPGDSVRFGYRVTVDL